MGTKGRILLHLAAALVGWGIVQSQHPASSVIEEPIAPGKSSVREARDREAGEKLLRRLVPDLVPPPPLEVVRHEGTLEERVKKRIEEDPFAADATAAFPVDYIRCLQEEISETIHGIDSPELSHAFRHGRLDANRILASLRERFPDLAGEALFPRAVFLELFKIEPTRAAVLLDGLDAAERTDWLSAEFRMRSEPTDPFEQVRFTPTDRSDSPPFYLAWTDLAVSNQCDDMTMFSGREMGTLARQYWDQYGSDYTNWLFDQPPTKGREKLLNALASTLELDEPEIGAALKKRLSNR